MYKRIFHSIGRTPLILFGFIFLLRLIGVTHGYPYIFNSDEPALVQSAIGLRFNPWIDHFDWPHLNYYLNYFVYFVFIKFRGILNTIGVDGFLQPLFPIIWNDGFVFYFLSRTFNTFLSVISGIPLFLVLRDLLQNKKIALYLMIVYTFLPYAVFHAHFALQDTALLFFITWAVFFLYRYVQRGEMRSILLSTTFISFATSIKYNGMLFLALIPFFVYLVESSAQNTFFALAKRFITIGFACLAVFIGIFLICNPSIFRYPDEFWSYKGGVGFLWQLTQNLNTYPVNEYFSHLWMSVQGVAEDTGYIFSIVWILSLLYVRKSKLEQKQKWFVAILTVFSILYTLNASRYVLSGSRFFLPIYSLMAISVGVVLFSIRKHSHQIILFVLIAAPILYFDIFLFRQFSQRTTVELAIEKYQKQALNSPVFIKGEELERANALHNVKLKQYRGNSTPGAVIISTRVMREPGLRLIDAIEGASSSVNKYKRRRFGPDIFLYEAL